MARPLRIEFPGAVYHVTSRGNSRASIYADDNDRLRFLAVLAEVVKRYNWLCHAYCLMDNHYHLLIETPEGNLSAGMRQLNGVYTQTYNRSHQATGHLFQGRYKAILVEKENHLLELCRYVVLNPQRAGINVEPKNYRWSSYPATVDLVQKPDFLSCDWLLANFANKKGPAQVRYCQFVKDGLQNHSTPWENVAGSLILGSAAFVQKIKDSYGSESDLTEIPRHQRYLGRPPLAELFTGREELSKAERNEIICRSYLTHGYTLKEIAGHLGKHYTTISKVVNTGKN